MNMYMWRREVKTLSPNKGRPRNERAHYRAWNKCGYFYHLELVEKVFLGLEIDKSLGPKNLKHEEETLLVLKVFDRVIF